MNFVFRRGKIAGSGPSVARRSLSTRIVKICVIGLSVIVAQWVMAPVAQAQDFISGDARPFHWETGAAVSPGGISSVSGKTVVPIGGSLILEATATDSDLMVYDDGLTPASSPASDTFSYEWGMHVSGGIYQPGDGTYSAVPNKPKQIKWTAPSDPGTYTVYLNVNDTGDPAGRNDGGMVAATSLQVDVIGGTFSASANAHFELEGANERDLVVLNPASSSNVTTYKRRDNQPTGTTYQWSITAGSSYVQFVGSTTGQFVSLRPRARCVAGAVTLRLRYSKSGVTKDSQQTLSVHQPWRPNSTQAIGALQKGWLTDPTSTSTPPQQRWGYGRIVIYTIKSQLNVAVPNVLSDETVTPASANLTQGDADTNEDGQVADYLYTFATWGGTTTVHSVENQTITVGGWQANGPFWRNRITDTDAPDIIVTLLN